MSRVKGTPKTGGRKAGTPNKITGTLKEFLSDLIDDNREQIKQDLESLSAKDRLQMSVPDIRAHYYELQRRLYSA